MPSEIMIIGPSPEIKKAGGIVTHIRTLMSLSVFKNAQIFDPESIYGKLSPRIFAIFVRIFLLRKTIRICKCKVILINTSIQSSSLAKLMLIFYAIPKKLKKNTLIFFHGGRFDKAGFLKCNLIRASLKRIVYGGCHFYFLSKAQSVGFERLFPSSPINFFRNFSDSNEIIDRCETTSKTVRIIYVGRIVAAKGVFDIIEAFSKIVSEKKSKNVKLTLVGDGKEFTKIQKIVKGRSLSSVNLTGYLHGKKLDEIYRNSDIFVLPSYHPEGFPYTIIEAMRSGLAIVASPKGILSEIIKDGITGFKVAPGYVDGLVEIIKKLINDSKLRNRIGRNNQNFFKENLSKRAAESFYQDLLSQYIR